MYEAFFKLQSKPFDLLPNPNFLYMSKAHGKALSYLRYGIQERSGFILLTGEVGSGKTTLIRELIKNHLGNVTLAKVFNTRADSQQLLTMINDDFGLETEGRSKAALVRDLNEFLIDMYADGRQCVLIVDEAQNLPPELLEEIRMLSNLETDGGKLLQIVLVGQPELRDHLNTPQMLQLRQRIQIYCHLRPLNEEETKEYIYHRLEKAGNRDAIRLTPAAVALINKCTRGIPRLVNILCDYVMVDAFMSERRRASKADIEEIVEELEFEKQYWSSEHPGASDSLEPAEELRQRSLRPPLNAKGSKTAGRVLKLLNSLESRLDALEREFAKMDPSMTVQLIDRLQRLERITSNQKEQIDNQMAMYRNTMMPTMTVQPPRPPQPMEAARERGWFSRLLFGSE